MEESFVIDTSAIIEKAISKLVQQKKIAGKIIVPHAALAELEHQANSGQETGFLGLEELQSLQKLNKQEEIALEFKGKRPDAYQIEFAKNGGEIDAMIRELAYNEGATLVTADKIQAEAAKAVGVKTEFIVIEKYEKELELEKFFDATTMSVHLKEDCFPLAKKGKPGNWELVPVTKEKLSQMHIQRIAEEAVEKSRIDPKAFIEVSRKGSTILQYRNYRIIIVKPPVSDGWEITAVKPLKQLSLEEYNLPEEIVRRIKEKAQGIVIAGETGSGKSTFAQGVAEFYAKNNRVVKTVESPRDLVLPDVITQYSKNFATSEEIHDILFLSRPDNVIFDEVRDTPDFKLYIDLRLGGSSCIGVLHSASPIDAIQRFIGRLDTGMIPSVVDTIIFIEKGNIKQVLVLKMSVKVPTGMSEADLARPVIDVVDFATKNLAYEIYSYGEETVVIPVGEVSKKSSPARSLAAKQLEKEMLRYVSSVEAEVVDDHNAVVYVPEPEIARVIGKGGKMISEIEKRIGLHIDVKAAISYRPEKKLANYTIVERGNYLILRTKDRGQPIDTFIEDDFLFTATTSKKGEIKISKKTEIGQKLLRAFDLGKKVELRATKP